MSFRNIWKILRINRLTCTYSAGFLIVKCSEKPKADQKLQLDISNLNKLTFEYLIKQSTVDAVNSASQALTVTYVAIETASVEYRSLLSELIVLLRETTENEITDDDWDRVVQIRSDIEDKKIVLARLIDYMDYVQKMAVAASEISYLSGMDNLSITLADRIDNALNNIKKQISTNKELEEEYSYVQQQCIIKTKYTEESEEKS